MTFPSHCRRVGLALAAAALVAAGPALAQAITAVDGHAKAGQTGIVDFAFDFGSPIQVTSISFDLGYNPFLLHPTPHFSQETFQGAPIDLDVALSSAGSYGASLDASGLHAAWYALDFNTFQPLPPLPLSGTGTISFRFLIDSRAAPGSSLPISLGIDFGDQDGNALPHASAMAQIVVDAVPEPSTWALALTGLLALGSMVWRRNGAVRRRTVRT
jgi:hypothetical protein